MRTRTSGVVVMVSSALAFGTSGTLVKPLLESGWSPAAAVTARILLAAAILAVPGVLAIRGRFGVLWRARWRITVFAGVAVAGVQLGYFAAVQRIPVSAALLIEYLAPVGLVVLAWARTRRRPSTPVLVGAAVAVAGLLLVIGPTGTGTLDPLGVLFAALAAIGVGVYYVMGARADDALPPVTMIAASLLLGGSMLAVLAAVRVLPFSVSFGDVRMAGAEVPWWVPVAAVAVVSTAYAYISGIVGIARLGERLASFLGLFEVVFAGAFAWLLLGEALGPLQLGGAVLILVGVLLIRRDRGEAPAIDGSEGRPLSVPDTPLPVEPSPLTGPIAAP